MKKYAIYHVYTTMKFMGEVLAKSESDAMKKADKDFEEDSPNVCHQCSDELGGNDILYLKTIVEEVN